MAHPVSVIGIIAVYHLFFILMLTSCMREVGEILAAVSQEHLQVGEGDSPHDVFKSPMEFLNHWCYQITPNGTSSDCSTRCVPFGYFGSFCLNVAANRIELIKFS